MPRDTVRHLFPQLVANGYVPLPNVDKVCKLPRWPTVVVDERQARLWTRQSRWPAIGLRVEAPLLVLDLDLPDPDIAEAMRDIIPDVVFERALERLGSPPKTAFFLRLRKGEQLFHELHTRRYTFGGASKVAFAVQAFGGGGGARQFGAFGPHSHDEDGTVLKHYSWVAGFSPATTPIWELPELTRAEVLAVLDAADALLARWPGLIVDISTSHGEAHQTQVFDLTEEMVFVDGAGDQYSFDELVQEAKDRRKLNQPELRITGSFTNDPTSSGSPRCKVFWSRNKGLSIVDYKTGKTHHKVPSEDTPFDPASLAFLKKFHGGR